MKTATFIYPDYGTPASYPELIAHSGQRVTVLGRVKGNDPEVEHMYRVKFEDGVEAHAFASELTHVP